MASMRDFLDNMAAPVRSRGAVRLALHNPNARSASDIAGVERTARTLGMGYGLADAGGQDAALEARAREIEQNPVADAWTAKDEENIAFLNEDQQALADVYDSLVASGILHEADADRETVINASGAGDDVAAAWKRGVILNRIAGYGLQFQRGEYENLDELRANILAAQKELEALRGNASDALGIYGAIEQLPRMIGYDAQYAGAGALVGGTIGSAVPGIGTLAGAGVGGAMGMAYTAANSEQGSFAADLLVQKDDAGNYLDPAAVQKAASLYGLLSGAVEVGGDALMFKLFKPVGGTIREAFSRRAARDAIREAAANRSLWPALRAFAGGAGKAAAVEGAQEFAQEGISTQIEATAKNLLSDAGANYYREQQAGAFSREGLSRMLEAGMAAAKTGPWFYAIPGGIRLTLDTRSALRAREFAEAHKELADKVAATRTRELSPARMESYLQTAGLDGDVLIPADAAWELQRKGTDLAGPLGWDVRDMEESAALGHDLVMPAARLQALLPPEQMKAVADIMRESPHAKSALEAANLNEDLPADMDGLIEQAEDDALERSAIEGELERLRGEMTQAVASAPHLVGQIASGADAETSVGRYVDEHLGLIVRRARDISRMGIPMSDTLSRVSLQGLLKDEQGRTVTPEEADALAGRNAEEEALAPFWDEVWGKLDANSLRTDFPNAPQELAYLLGRGLFAKKGQGLSVDVLAEELKTRGLLNADADSSTLVEKLKGMRRPTRKTRGKALFQPLNEGVNLDRMVSTTVIHRKYPAATLKEKRKAVSNGEKARVLQAFREGVRNEDTGWIIGMSGTDFDEHLKSDARSQFVMDQYEAVSALPEMMKRAVLVESHGDSHGRAEVKKVHRFYAPLSIDGDTYSVVLTVKEFQNGVLSVDAVSPMKLYHHRLEKKMLPAELGATASQGNPDPHTGSTSSYSLRELLEDVKDNDGNPYLQSAYHGTLHRFDEFSLDAYYQAKGYQTPDEAFASGTEAMEKVIAQQTDVLDAMFRPDVGSISFYWGTPGKGPRLKGGSGVSHLIARRNAEGQNGEAVARKMVEVLAYGQMGPEYGPPGGQHRNVSHDGHTAVLSLYRFGSRETWLLTGWKDNPAGGTGTVNAPSPTQTSPSGIQGKLGAAGSPSSNIQPLGADGKPLFHDAGRSSALGSTTPDGNGHYVIRLFAGANLSTLSHETAHVFFLEMERLEREGLADERMLTDLAALRDWTAAMDDDAALKAEYDRYQKQSVYGGAEFESLSDFQKEDARNRAKQEMLARGFEQYLREGKAPSPQLEGVFARFRKWLMRVYRDALDLHVELSDEVRDVFDRMLAHEEEMELRAEADSSPLIQRPKGMRERQTVFQTEEKNAAGVPLSRVTRIEGTVTREELDAALSSLAGQDLPNLIEGVTAQVNANQKRKMASKVAGDKSMENGFSREEHRGVAAQIANAWKWAAEARRTGDEKNNMPDVGIRRYVSALELNEKDAFAWLTVKETPTGLRIYSVELMDEKKLRDIVGNGTAETATTTLHRSFEEIIERLAKPVNEQKQSFLQTGNDEAPLVREGMTRKPDSAAARVVTVEGNIVPDFEGGKGKHKTRKLVEWLYSYFDAPVDVTIASTSQKVRINKSGLEASVKKEKKPGHREAYGPLKELIEKAEYDRFEPADERHRSRVQGQDVYHSALRLGEQLYSVQLKFDIPNAAEVESRKRVGEKSIEDSRYKDHELREIEIAPAEVDGAFTRPSADAISKVSLGVLRGSVKPSGIDGGTLFQGISDEVRDMFDRMLAHEEEMELRAEAADVREETARLLDALELKGAGRQEIEGLITAAKDEAAERLRRARDADRLEQRRAWTREAREQMEREQVYVTRRAICRTPIDLAGFNDVNGEELGRALVGKLPGAAAWREGGVEPEVFAAEQGYGSAAAMARDIIDSPTPEERVKQLVDKRQAEHDALFDADEYLFGREQLAEQRERIAEALEVKVQAVTAEQRHRRETAGRTVSGEETIPAPDDCADCGSAARRLAGRDRLRARARAVLDKRPMGEEVMPEQFRRAASRWMREERRAILRGDFGKALQANCRTRINIELARQSAERRGMLRTLEKKAKEFLEMDRADSDARFAVLVLSQNIGLFNPTRGMLADAGGKGWENVEAFAARMREVGLMGAEDALDRELFTTSRAWKGMKWGEFRPYAETMRMIMHMERESRTAETASGRVALEARAREIADSIHENNTRREPEARAERNEAVELLKKFHAAHLKADTVALLDGDIMGAAWRAIVRPVSDAAGKRAERLRRERDVLRKLFSVYSRRELEDMKGKRFTVPGIPDAITKEQALSVLLNSGSAGNLRRLMAGRNLAEEQIRAIVDTLDERDVRFAQAVWDYFETFGKEISDLEESLTGVRPEAAEARPVQTRFGLLRGGYYPVACDRELSARPVDTDRLGTQTGGMFPSLSRGPLKQRQAVGLGTPLSLSLDVIPRHVAETVHMLTFRRPVTETAKILHRREVNGAIRETAGVAAAEALDGWLHHVAGERPARGGWDRAASWARKNAALYTMGFRLSAMLARMTGLLSPVAEIGPRWALRGVVDSYGRGSPLDVCRTVMELSPMMRDRIMSADREVFEVSSRLMEPDSSSRASDPFARMKSFMETRGSVPMGWVRMYFADLPIWNGAYARALKENGGDIAEAVLYADAVVERARAGGAARDLAAVRPGWEPGRLMTMFYSCFSALYNLSARRVAMLDMRRDAAAVYRLATLALPTWFAEPALMGALPGGGPGTRNVGDKTDAEDWIVWGAKEAFFHPAGMVFDMREAASPESCPESCQESWQDAFDSAMRFGARAGKALQDGADGRELLSGRETTEQDTGFITARELQLLETFRDWLDGTSPERELGSLIRKKNRQAENE